MPELPEVEIYRRYVEKHALRQRIERVRVPDRRILRGVTAPALDRALRGRRLVSTRRHGKHLFVQVERSEWLYLHFGMTGDLHYYSDGETPRFSKVILDFTRNRHLAFEDARLFGAVSLVHEPEEFIARKRLGADPLDETFKPALFRDALRARRGAIKAVLMSQLVVAGLGNLYVDETLYQTSIHPLRPIAKLTDAEIASLHRTIKRVLNVVIERNESNRDLPRSFLTTHRAEGESCPKCGAPILRAVIAGRTTYYCDAHQR
jgi:formamidopyrimidine-DNA glycosylase